MNHLMLSRVRPSAGSRADERGYTLLEMMIALAVAGLILTPLIAWMLLVFDRSSDTAKQEQTVDYAALRRTYTRDVESAKSAAVSGPGGLALSRCGTSPLPGSRPEEAVVLELATLEIDSGALGTGTWIRTQYIVKPETDESGAEHTALWRRRCSMGTGSTVVSTDDTRVLRSLVSMDAGNPTDLAGFADIQCNAANPTGDPDADAPGIAACESVTSKVHPDGTERTVVLRATRRPDDEPETGTDPKAIIRCEPSCTGYRDADKEFKVTLDSSRSRNVTLRYWSFGTPGSTGGVDVKETNVPFRCNGPSEGPSIWDNAAQECRYTVTLWIVGGDPESVSIATQVITVRNYRPTIRIIQPASGVVTVKRSVPVPFEVVVEDPDTAPADRTYRWNFGDGTTSNVLDPGTHTYQKKIAAGHVTFKVTDGDGAEAMIDMPLQVDNNPPESNFTPSRTSFTQCADGQLASSCDDRIVRFTGTYNGTKDGRAYDPDGAVDPLDGSARAGIGPVRDYQWVVQEKQGINQPAITHTLTTTPSATVPYVVTEPTSAQSPTSRSFIWIKFPNRIATYVVSLIVTDTDDAQDVQSVELSANQPPRAVFDVTPTPPRVNANREEGTLTYPSRFTFDGTRSFDPDPVPGLSPAVVAYTWTATNLKTNATVSEAIDLTNSGSTLQPWTPALTPGKWRVTLTVRDQLGATSPGVDTRVMSPAATNFRDVKVNPPPTISYSFPGRIEWKVPYTFNPSITDELVDPDDAVTSYVWTYREPGGPWLSAGGGATANVQWATRTGADGATGGVRVVATDDEGAVTTQTWLFPVRLATPTSTFSLVRPGAPTGATGQEFEFQYTGRDPDSNSVTCAWTFEGATPATWDQCTNPTTTWATPRTTPYKVTLRVTDDDTLWSETTMDIRILVPLNFGVKYGVNPSLSTANPQIFKPFDGGPTNRVVTLRFDPAIGTLTSDPNINGSNGNFKISYMTWDFGDGSAPKTVNGLDVVGAQAWVDKQFKQTATQTVFDVTATVYSQSGLSKSMSLRVILNLPPVPSVAGQALPAVPTLVANCPTSIPDATRGTGSYSVLGCNVAASIYPAGSIDGTGTIDPDGSPTFTSIALSETPAGQYCWKDSTSGSCLSTEKTPTNVPIGAQATMQTRSMYLTVKDGYNTSDTQEFKVYFNNKPLDVTVLGSMQLKHSVPTDAAQVRTEAKDADVGSSLTYNWRFLDNNGIEIANDLNVTGRNYPIVTITNAQLAAGLTGTVQLEVVDNQGYRVSTSRSFTMAGASPVAVIKVTTTNGTTYNSPTGLRLRKDPPFTSPLTATFSGLDSFVANGGPGDTINSWSWSVSPTTGVTPSTYPQTGSTFSATFNSSVATTWIVTLTVNGTATASIPVRFNTPPSVVWTCPTFYSTTAPIQLLFSDNSTDPDNNGTYQGVGTLQNRPQTISYSWGDGSPLETRAWQGTTSHNYLNFNNTPANGYTVTATVTDVDGATASKTCRGDLAPGTKPPVRINRLPVIDPTSTSASPAVIATPTPGTRSVTVTAGVKDADYGTGVVPNYPTMTWRLLDAAKSPVVPAQTGTGSTVNFTVNTSSPTTYYAEVSVVDTDGGAAPASAVTSLVPIRINQAPRAGIVDNGTGVVTLTTWTEGTLDAGGPFATASVDDDTVTAAKPFGDITSYHWILKRPDGSPWKDFETPNRTTTIVPDRSTFDASGAHPGQISLQVKDGDGIWSPWVNKTYSVFNSPPEAIAKVVGPSPIPANTPTHLTGIDSYDHGPGSSITGYKWRLHTGRVATGLTLYENWTAKTTSPDFVRNLPPGDYTAELVVYDSDNDPSNLDVDTGAFFEGFYLEFTVLAGPQVNIVTTNPDRTNPTQIEFQGSTVESVSFDGLGSTPTVDADTPTNQLTFTWKVLTAAGDLIRSQTGSQFNDVTFLGSGRTKVTLEVTDPQGNIGTRSIWIVMNSAPTINLVGSPKIVNPNDDTSGFRTFSFDATGTQDPDQFDQIQTWTWRFLDANGQPSGPNATPPVETSYTGPKTHDFPVTPGRYYAELTVTDMNGGSAKKTEEVRVNDRPVPALAAGPYTIRRNVPFTVSASGSSDPDGIKTYEWTFKTSETTPRVLATLSTSAPVGLLTIDPPVAQFPVPLTGTVELRVRDNLDQWSAAPPATAAFTLTNAPPVAVATISGSDIGPPGMVRSFAHDQSTDPDGTLPPTPAIAEPFVWQVFTNFGGNLVAVPGSRTVRTTLNGTFSWTFNNAGPHVVRLTVTDKDGVSSTDDVPVVINRPPIAGIKDGGPSPFTATRNVPKTFDGSSPTYSHDDDPDDTIDSWVWTVIDPSGNESAPVFGATRSITFTTAGMNRIRLTVFDKYGDFDEIEYFVSVT